MKKLVSMFLLLAAGCSAPGSTEINRPSPDVNGTRQLLLTTSFIPNEGATFASAAYSDSSVRGFGPDVVITCNSDTIVNTLRTTGSPDTERFIEESTTYIWSYQGPDTSFTFDMPSPGELQITEPNVDSSSIVFLFDSLQILYQPVGPCSSLRVILTDINDTTFFLDTARINTQFDPATGLIHPIPPQSLSQLSGQGTITIIKVSDSTFSIPSIHSIMVKDTSVSQPIRVVWEE